jgi:hypothetical protein
MAKTELLLTAESVAETFFHDFSDPTSTARGAKFVWPETYINMCGRFTRVYHNTSFAREHRTDVPDVVAVAVGEQVAKKVAGLPTTVLDDVFRKDPATWISVTTHLGEVIVVDKHGVQKIRFSVQTEALQITYDPADQG